MCPWRPGGPEGPPGRRAGTARPVGIAVPRITGLETAESGNWIGRYERARSSLDLGTRPALVRPGSFVSWASTACVVARVDAIGDGFDARMRVGEDLDFGWRAIRRGWRMRYEPTVAAAHEHRVGVRDWFVRKAEYGTGAQPLAERHPGSVAPAVLAPWSTVMVVALLAQRRWSVPAATASCAVTAVRIAQKLGPVDQSGRLGVRLTVGGAVAALSQTGALLTRHWWPATAVGCLVSRRVRRAAAVAAVADIALEYRRAQVGLDPVRYGVARPLDDLAYGAGVWFSAVRGRSVAALRPRLLQAPRPLRNRPRAAGTPRPRGPKAPPLCDPVARFGRPGATARPLALNAQVTLIESCLTANRATEAHSPGRRRSRMIAGQRRRTCAGVTRGLGRWCPAVHGRSLPHVRR
ncbi:glycosyltransferase family 2 protein [Streptomyces sp. NPDC000941]